MTARIYGLYDPRSPSEIRYVGKTVTSLSRRLINHVYKARSGRSDSAVAQWVRQLLKEGERPGIQLLEETAGDCQAAERKWVLRFDNLLNRTRGGNGAHYRVELPEEIVALLGVISDARVAEKVGCSREFIGYERRKRNIPASGDRSRVRPNLKGRPQVHLKPWVIDALGTMTDTELAQKAGVSQSTIWARRKALGIPSFAEHHKPPLRKGAAHHNSKMTMDKARKVRAMYEQKNISQQALADLFDLHVSTVNSILRHKTWREENVEEAVAGGRRISQA